MNIRSFRRTDKLIGRMKGNARNAFPKATLCVIECEFNGV